MRSVSVGLLAACLLCANAAIAQTTEQSAAIESAERIGRELYEHDRAAWLATDAMLAELGQEARGRVRGWITEREGESVVVLFVADGEPLTSIYRAVLRDNALAEQGSTAEPLNEAQVRLYRARQVAARLPVPCSGRYNSVTIRSSDETADVYLMPATTENDVVRVGGFQRVAVNLATGEVAETESFSRSCLELSRDMSRQGARAAGLFFTHLLSATPTETHVFLNLSQRLPLFVGAGGGVWQINEGRVTLVETR